MTSYVVKVGKQVYRVLTGIKRLEIRWLCFRAMCVWWPVGPGWLSETLLEISTCPQLRASASLILWKGLVSFRESQPHAGTLYNRREFFQTPQAQWYSPWWQSETESTLCNLKYLQNSLTFSKIFQGKKTLNIYWIYFIFLLVAYIVICKLAKVQNICKKCIRPLYLYSKRWNIYCSGKLEYI